MKDDRYNPLMKRTYRLSGALNPFQRKLTEHLVDWKIDELGIADPGSYKNRRGESVAHDALLPKEQSSKTSPPHIYPPARDELLRHRKTNPFRLHRYFFHVASSQAANINLFLPILMNPRGADVLRKVNPDIATLDASALDKGYCIEFWGGNYAPGSLPMPGLLRDKSESTGTDSDIAIAYRNARGEKCLWLIEHKLTEAEFTTCGGARSKGRSPSHDCGRSTVELLENKSLCYYHDARAYAYWTLTEANLGAFSGHADHSACPFKDGMNQLWRNQLLGLALEHNGYHQVTFSVAKHPSNSALDGTISAYRSLTRESARFTVVTFDAFVAAAESEGDAALRDWAAWYRHVYLPDLDRT